MAEREKIKDKHSIWILSYIVKHTVINLFWFLTQLRCKLEEIWSYNTDIDSVIKFYF